METEEQPNQVFSNIEWLRVNNIIELNEKNALDYFMTSPFYNSRNAKNDKAKKSKGNILYEYRIKSIKNGIIIVEKVYIEAGKNEVLEIFYMVSFGGVYNIYKANILMDILKTHLTYINTEVQKLME